MIIPVILSGGAGTRLWPLSRESAPKQFQPVTGDDSLLAVTVGRLASVGNLGPPLVVCNEAHVDLVHQQLPDAAILAEPDGRNTAPAIAAAALNLRGDDVMVVLPSDHLINDEAAFVEALNHAIAAAEDGWLVAFGIVPSNPATGFGYIEPGIMLNEPTRRITRFVEKPDAETATRHVEDGYLWNSGMFVMKAGRYLEELQSHRPDIAEAVAGAVTDGSISRLDWQECPSESIDYAVMEETNRAAVVPLDAGWSDVGTWRSLLDLGPTDADGNVITGSAVLLDTHRSYVRGEGRTVAVIGVEDLIIVETEDAVLVVHKDRTEDVKAIIDLLPESLL